MLPNAKLGKKFNTYMQEFPNNGSSFWQEVRNTLSLQK